ncbi:MAG: radical SAM family heme chaperone HemW [Magnetococcales bacterium]|nr:radical SAM family heme chaperone HemW [Magnetococcales bacterium]
MSQGGDLPPLGLYLHVPYCVRKCPYCDFHSTVQSHIPEQGYLAAVERELHFWRGRLTHDDRPLQSLFLGGGTPSLLEGRTVQHLLQTVRSLWPLAAGCEITLESNPESCTPAKVDQWLAAGINRLSLGIQAFNQDRLIILERPHTLDEARQAIRSSRQGGFNNLNLDLIFATPGQTLAGWQRELEEAMDWQPEHLSCYGLSLEGGTPFERQHRQGLFSLLDEEQELALFETTRQILSKGGWQPYEISNYAKPGRACRHNLNYWRLGDYLGIGPSAHGCLTQRHSEPGAARTLTRTVNQSDNYLEKQQNSGCCLHSETRCTQAEAATDALLMGLRLQEGMNRETYQRVSGHDLLEQRPKGIENCLEAGLIRVEPERITLTQKGVPLTDAVLSQLL